MTSRSRLLSCCTWPAASDFLSACRLPAPAGLVQGPRVPGSEVQDLPVQCTAAAGLRPALPRHPGVRQDRPDQLSGQDLVRLPIQDEGDGSDPPEGPARPTLRKRPGPAAPDLRACQECGDPEGLWQDLPVLLRHPGLRGASLAPFVPLLPACCLLCCHGALFNHAMEQTPVLRGGAM